MMTRAAIQEQINIVRRLSASISIELDMLDAGISQEPMGFIMSSIHHLHILAAAAQTLALSCEHTLEEQRLQAQFEAKRVKQ